MTKTEKRRNRGIYISRARRKYLRDLLKSWYGESCCWCREPMEFPEYGKPIENLENMATIEHYFSKFEEDPSHLHSLRLSHHRCNK